MGLVSARWPRLDRSGELRWDEYTRYDAEHRFGINTWNALGSVTIQRSESDANLEFRDYRDCGDGVLCRWMPGSGTDLISFNVCEMDKISPFDRRGAAVHEVGHALGLAYPSGSRKSKYWCKNSVMYYGFARHLSKTPQAHDRSDTTPCGPGRQQRRLSRTVRTRIFRYGGSLRSMPWPERVGRLRTTSLSVKWLEDRFEGAPLSVG